MKILLMVIVGVILGTVSFACGSDTPYKSPETVSISPPSETIDRITNPSLVIEEVTVKIEFSTEEGEYISSGVIVGDGHFAVTYAPEISAASTRVRVTHVGSRVVTEGSIIYIDEIFGTALIHLTDDLGDPVVISQRMPYLGDELIIGDFLPIEEEDLIVTRYSTIAGFEFDGLIMRFDGIVGSGNTGGPAINGKGQLVGIVTHGLDEKESGIVISPETFTYGLTEKLIKYGETVIGNVSRYELDLIGIPARVAKPLDWNILSGFGYFDIRPPEPTDNSDDPASNGYKVIGIINVDSSGVETSEEVLNRAIAEFGDAFERVPELVIPDQRGLDSCELLMTVKEYSRTAFEARGYLIPGGWVSSPGVYTGLCTGIAKDQQVLVFVESYDVYDIVNDDGLFKKIALGQE